MKDFRLFETKRRHNHVQHDPEIIRHRRIRGDHPSRTALSFAQVTDSDEPTPPLTATQGTVEWVTHEKTIVPANARVLNLDDFDTNGDGVITREEVGDRLFHIFDKDGNGVIDNLEYEKKMIATVVPTKKTTKITYDYNSDGVVDKEVTTSEQFMKGTQLSRFDASGKGLTPA